jgi:protein phosphatase slingshot
MSCNLMQYKEFIDNEMLLILGQMDKATLIFDHLYLVSHLETTPYPELRDTARSLAWSQICLCFSQLHCCH